MHLLSQMLSQLQQISELIQLRLHLDLPTPSYAKKIANLFVNLSEEEQFECLFELEQQKEVLFAQCDPDIIEMNRKVLQDSLIEVEYLRVLYLNSELTGPGKIFESSLNYLETLLIKIKAYL